MVILNLSVIKKGFERVLDPEFEVNPRIREDIESGKASRIDAFAADVIVQAAVFGKIVYG